MTLDEMRQRLEGVLSPRRFRHSLGVMNTAIELAARYKEDVEKAAIAGLLHDCARDIRGEEAFIRCQKVGIIPDQVARVQPELLHGPLGARLAELEFGVTDPDILRAIHYHTTGYENMDALSKIIYISDYIEPGRSFEGVEDIRREAFFNINRAMLMALNKTVIHILEKGSLIHCDTVKARNYLILQTMQ